MKNIENMNSSHSVLKFNKLKVIHRKTTGRVSVFLAVAGEDVAEKCEKSIELCRVLPLAVGHSEVYMERSTF